MKICTKCKIEKPASEFYKRTNPKSGLSSRCRTCLAADNKRWQLENPEKAKEAWRKAAKKGQKVRDKQRKAKRYGLTVAELSVILSEATNCQIYNRSFEEVPAHIDHCHDTGKIRGVLCINCNTGIGNLRDSIDLLEKAIKYLQASVAQRL